MVATSKGKEKDWVFVSVIFSFFYAVLDEVHQVFVPGRSASLGDVFLDSVGIAFAFLIYFIRLR
jgi:VanZ family protein